MRSARLRLTSQSFGRSRPVLPARYHGFVARSSARVWLVIFVVPIILVLGAIGYLAWRQSVPAVRVEFQPVPQFIGARTPITLVLRATPRRGGVGGHPAQPGRHARQRRAADLLGRPRRQRAARAAHRGGRHARPARGRGEPGSARARRLLAAHPRGRPHDREPADHARLHAAHARGPGLDALSLPRRWRAGGGARQGRRARRRQRGRPVLPRLPGGRPGHRAARGALRAAVEPRPERAGHRHRAGRSRQRGLARARGGHPPAQVPDGHHRGERAVPREQDARAPARARADPRPTSSSTPSSP